MVFQAEVSPKAPVTVSGNEPIGNKKTEHGWEILEELQMQLLMQIPPLSRVYTALFWQLDLHVRLMVTEQTHFFGAKSLTKYGKTHIVRKRWSSKEKKKKQFQRNFDPRRLEAFSKLAGGCFVGGEEIIPWNLLHWLLSKNNQARIQDFGQWGPAEFWPQGGGLT